MHSVNVFLAVLAAVSVSMGAISGKVTDTSGVAIPGATVQLEKGGQPVTTDGNGNFSITASAIVNRISRLSVHNFSATMQGGFLCVNVGEKSVVSITVFNLNGKMLSTVRETMEAGINSVALPYRGAGVYLYRVKVGGNKIVLKGSSMDGVSNGAGAASDLSSVKTGMAKQAKTAASINDVIAVTKSGYLNYRVIVRNSDTTGIVIIMLPCADTVRDVDSNLYQAVKIGNQVWTVENLRTTKYKDGSAIPLVANNWDSLKSPAYCIYNNTSNSDSIAKFGALYTWYAVQTGKLAPKGWHVPTDWEWRILENYLVLNGYNWDGSTSGNKIAKSLAAKTDWYSSKYAGEIGNDLTKNNSSGFSALPGGFRYDNGTFYAFVGGWWSTSGSDASCAYNRELSYTRGDLEGDNLYNRGCGFSVRLVRDSVRLE